MIEWIGIDENKNELFKNNNKEYFIFNNGFLDKVDNINFSKIKKNDYLLSIPTIINNDNKTQLKINLKFNDYTFYGYLTNNYVFHPEYKIAQLYHVLMHLVSSFGHHIIIAL